MSQADWYFRHSHRLSPAVILKSRHTTKFSRNSLEKSHEIQNHFLEYVRKLRYPYNQKEST